MRGIIVAAGRSSRLYPRTLDRPKPLLRVPESGPPLIRRAVELLRARGIDRVTVVVGYLQEHIREALGEDVDYLLNPFYAETNNLASLWLALVQDGQDDVLYTHGDLVYEPSILDDVLGCPGRGGTTLAVDVGSVHEEAMKVRLEDGRFAESSKAIPPERAWGEWIGMARLERGAIAPLRQAMEELLEARRFQDYDTSAFNLLAQRGTGRFDFVTTDGRPWKEIDDEADLATARAWFAVHEG